MSTEVKILTVDDEPSITEIIKEFIELAGYDDIVVLNDSEHAIQKIKRQKFSIIITDHHMPNFSGLDVLKSTRQEDGVNVKTPVVFLTAMNDEIKSETEDKYDSVSVLNKVDNLHLIGQKVKELLSDLK